MARADERCLLQLFEQVVPEGQWRELENRERRAQIYTLPVVVGMMLLQRLNERGTQQEAVHQIAAGRLDGLLPDGKRGRAGKISPRSLSGIDSAEGTKHNSLSRGYLGLRCSHGKVLSVGGCEPGAATTALTA